MIALFFVCVFLVWKAIRRRKTSVKRNTVVCFITTIFFLYPSLTEKSFGLFWCVTLYEDSWLSSDLEILCWKGKHIYWMVGWGLPMVLICFAMPIIGIIFMLSMIKNVEKDWFWGYFIFLYQGYRKARNYWEFANMIWKITVIAINVFIPRDQPFLKLAAGFAFLVVFFWI